MSQHRTTPTPSEPVTPTPPRPTPHRIQPNFTPPDTTGYTTAVNSLAYKMRRKGFDTPPLRRQYGHGLTVVWEPNTDYLPRDTAIIVDDIPLPVHTDLTTPEWCHTLGFLVPRDYLALFVTTGYSAERTKNVRYFLKELASKPWQHRTG